MFFGTEVFLNYGPLFLGQRIGWKQLLAWESNCKNSERGQKKMTKLKQKRPPGLILFHTFKLIALIRQDRVRGREILLGNCVVCIINVALV